MSISIQYVWLLWAGAFLIPWLLLYWRFPQFRRVMLWASLFTTPFGLTEPLFVPEYWSPPSLFDLAMRTGFDIESLIFCFGIGGVGAVLYNVITGQVPQPVSLRERQHARHRYHWLAVSAPFIAFPLFYLAFDWNPIYPSIAAMLIGGIATVLCRPDLSRKVFIGGFLFLGYYALFILALEWSVPGYIGQVWNIDAISGLSLIEIPVEELLFAFSFGLYWAGLYEHLTWQGEACAS